MKKSLHTGARFLWRGFLASSSQPEALCWTYLKAIEESNFLRDAALFTASQHLDQLQTRCGPFDQGLEQLRLKIRAISGVKRALQSTAKFNVDHVVSAIVWLAVNERQSPSGPQKDWNDVNPPLQEAQWLHIYGSRVYEPFHWQAVQDIIRNNGGLSCLKMFGTAWLVSW